MFYNNFFLSLPENKKKINWIYGNFRFLITLQIQFVVAVRLLCNKWTMNTLPVGTRNYFGIIKHDWWKFEVCKVHFFWPLANIHPLCNQIYTNMYKSLKSFRRKLILEISFHMEATIKACPFLNFVVNIKYFHSIVHWFKANNIKFLYIYILIYDSINWLYFYILYFRDDLIYEYLPLLLIVLGLFVYLSNLYAIQWLWTTHSN